jgi:multimeric flavodoxin WrbA
MKLVSLVSSLRKHGNTSNIAALLEERLKEIAAAENIDLEIQRVNLGDFGIKPCLGCRVCFDKGEASCPNKDGLAEVASKLMEADGVIAASPVYAEDVNGTMKTLIDRMAYNNHRPAFAGKSVLLVTTSGMGSTNHSLKTMSRAFMAWGFHIAGQNKFRMGALMNTSDIKVNYKNKINRAAIGLFTAIRLNKPVKPKFFSLLFFKVQQSCCQKEKITDTVDYAYWENNGWLKPDRRYYIPQRSNILKVKSARLIGSIVALFFT